MESSYSSSSRIRNRKKFKYRFVLIPNWIFNDTPEDQMWLYDLTGVPFSFTAKDRIVEKVTYEPCDYSGNNIPCIYGFA